MNSTYACMMGLVAITVPCKLGLEADPGRSILIVIKVACSNINWSQRSKITAMNWYGIHQTYVGKKPSTIVIDVLLKFRLHPSHAWLQIQTVLLYSLHVIV